MALLQDLIHKIEVAAANKSFQFAPALLAVLLVAVTYNLREYKNFSTTEAMDAAQLGRRIAEGKGYTTSFVRPFSLYLVERARQAKAAAPEAGKAADPARIREAHPDIANPPVYPLLLAGLMKMLPFDYTVSSTKQFWSDGGRFWRYQPDFLIALFDELLFVAVIVLAFLWARRLFDPGVAWTAAVVLLGSELLWRFSVSGLSTMLLLLFFMALIWCLTLFEAETREPGRGVRALPALAAAAGLLVGLGGLTQYAFAWLILPTLLFILMLAGQRRGFLCLITLVVFAAVMTPWIVRNFQISGTPFGTASYDVLKGTSLFPENRLDRSLSPNTEFFLSAVGAKLFFNSRPVFNNALFNLGGGWIGGFFLVGLLVGFRSPAIRHMRYFLLLSLGVLVVVQALGRTQLSEDSPEINSENLLVLVLPLVVIYGVSLFFTLLDQVQFPTPTLRPAVISLFGILSCLPMIFALFSRTSPVAYPPYHPLLIQQSAAWMKPDELMMSDVPWAVAWYGNRQCVWLTLNAVPDRNKGILSNNFFSINDFQKPVGALYLTQKSTDARFVSDWVHTGDASWGNFILNALVKRELPVDFPLRQMPTGYLPEQLFLSDWKRWQQPGSP
jgi:hypothetical protein